MHGSALTFFFGHCVLNIQYDTMQIVGGIANGREERKNTFYSTLLGLMTWALQIKLTEGKSIGRKVHYVRVQRLSYRRNEDSESFRPRGGKMGMELTHHFNSE